MREKRNLSKIEVHKEYSTELTDKKNEYWLKKKEWKIPVVLDVLIKEFSLQI